MSPAVARIANDVRYSLVQFCRSRQSIFLSVVFPVMLLLILGYLFGQISGEPTLYYMDGDGSPESKAFIAVVGSGGTLDLQDGSGMDLAQSLNDGAVSAYLVIPPGFGEGVAAARLSGAQPDTEITLCYDPHMSDYLDIVSTVRRAIDQYSMDTMGKSEPVSVRLQDTSTAQAGYVDFLLPGILGICIMFSAINETVSIIMRYQATGTLRKLTTTPLASIEWIASRMIAGTIVVLISVAASLIAAWLAFGYVPEISVLSVLVVIIGALTFTGAGVVVTQVFEGMQSANAAIYLVTLPLILISGTLFPVDRLPWMLQFMSILSPLTYLTGSLRNSASGDFVYAIMNLLLTVFLGVMVMIIGTAIMMGKEGHDI